MEQPEMTRKAKFSVVIGGVLLPLCLVYFVYQNLLARYTKWTFNYADLTFAYERQVMSEKPVTTAEDNRDEVVILGDSTGKSSLDPQAIRSRKSINLATNVGNALSSFYIMRGYLGLHAPPRCFVLGYQYNWKHSYEHFFEWTPYFHAISPSDLVSIWAQSSGGQFFPADRMGLLPYFARSVWSYLRLNDLHLAELQNALGQEAEFPISEVRARFIAEKGFQDNSVRRHLPGETFFNEDFHRHYFEKFEVSPTEDHYLLQMAHLAKSHRADFIVVAPPAAESDEAVRSAEFFRERQKHLKDLFALTPGVEVLAEQKPGPRSDYFDFTHMNRAGAEAFSRRMDAELERRCRGEKAI